MLQNLSIRNFILIDKLDLDFEKGFCVITGETGAGKSIILDALLFCLGGKVNIYNKITDNTAVTSVTASFINIPRELNQYLQDASVDYQKEVVIKSIQPLNKPRKFYINEQLVTIKTIEHIALYLLEIHGQNSHTSLLSSAYHIDILDDFANLNSKTIEVSKLYKSLYEIKIKIENNKTQTEKVNNEIEYLNFVVNELTALNIQKKEEEELENKRQYLRTQEKESSLIADLLASLDEGAITQNLSKILRLIGRKNSDSSIWQTITGHIEQAYDYTEKVIAELKSYLTSFNSNDLANIEERLFAIKEISRKYKISRDEYSIFLENSSNKLRDLQTQISNAHTLELELTNLEAKYYKLANELSMERNQAAIKLKQIVHESLAQLQMAKAVFEIEILQDITALTSKGVDKIRFLASTNPGLPMAPIDKVASGGELARFMLALKTALFDKYKKPLMIFDEIDVGIGGSVADSVARHLKKLSSVSQVLVITHQAQIASKANMHILVTKSQQKDTTNVEVKPITGNERIHEIARMISGNNITEASLKTAKELLAVY